MYVCISFKKDGDRKISPEMLTRREKIKKILQEDRFTDTDELIVELEIYDKGILIKAVPSKIKNETCPVSRMWLYF